MTKKKSKTSTIVPEKEKSPILEEEKSSNASKKKSKKSKVVPEKEKSVVWEEERPSAASKKPRSEIDEIFAGKKRKKPVSEKVEKEKSSENVDANSKKTKKSKKSEVSDEGRFVDPPSRPRKRTNDGLAIYTMEELGMDKADAGATPLCPFDCSCCF
ncbi:Protein of unknown function DUF1764, eukaryotic [Dillenia turbinata]|uniref:DUF1764 domain-containing protein n=1 Tax=Dillenia turbinata TaxID=194707 RepID=A0AAN8ULG3_9MAGN